MGDLAEAARARSVGWAVVSLCVCLGACESAPKRPPAAAATPVEAEPSRPAVPLAPAPASIPEELAVEPATEEVVVSAWAEPSHLPPGGGVVQILVRTAHRGGAAFPGVEVRLATEHGTLFSQGRSLVTDGRGITRDRLTAHQTTEVVMNAGGTRYRFLVPVLPEPE
jgi:hypothetical protein